MCIRIIAVSDYALQTIEGNEDKAKSSGLVKYLWPFGGVSQRTESVDFLFEQSFSVLSVELERLILTAEKSQTSIYGLEEKLGTVHDILARENFAISAANDELLAELWTRLGGNRAQVARFATNLQLLKELGHYREAALSKVVAALQVRVYKKFVKHPLIQLHRPFRRCQLIWKSCVKGHLLLSLPVMIYPWKFMLVRYVPVWRDYTRAGFEQNS